MKKLGILLGVLLAILVMPFTVNAAKKEPITVHMFRGEGCGYCAAALEFFESIEGEYGKYFNLETHEVWYDEDNASLMQDVAAYYGEDIGGVPYIIIGEKTFQGYAEQYDEDIINAITSAYESGNFVDKVAQIQNGEIEVSGKGTTTEKKEDKKDKSDKTTIIIIIVAFVGFIALVYFARDPEDNTSNTIEKEEKVVEEVKEEAPKKTEAKKTTVKKTTTKKTTTKKKTNKK